MADLVEEDLQSICEEADILMEAILSRLEIQPRLVRSATKLRVAKIFIDQIVDSENKIYLQKKYDQIALNIKNIGEGKPLKKIEE